MKLKDKAKIKVASLLYNIYTKCEMGVPFKLSEMFSELKLTGNAGPVIKQFGLFERIEKKGEGGFLCKWVKSAPNENMIEAVAMAIREYTKEASKAKQKLKECKAEPKTSAEKVNEDLLFPTLPSNMPGPIQAVCNLIMESMKQQNAYLRAMGVAVSDMQSKVDNLYTQLNN